MAVIYIVSPVRSERSSLVGWRCWRCPEHPSIQDSSKTGLSVTNLVRDTLSTSVRDLETKQLEHSTLSHIYIIIIICTSVVLVLSETSIISNCQ